MSSHGRVLSLLVAMLLSCCGLAVVCCVTGYTHGMHTLAFMAAEEEILPGPWVVESTDAEELDMEGRR